jgi:hypothetical protein
MYIADFGGNILNQDVDIVLDKSTMVPKTETISDSWTEIQRHINAGDYKTRYNLGDTKNILLDNGVSILMEIVAFDADIKVDGTTAAITWMTKDVAFMKPMNSNGDNVGGWKTSTLRSWLQNDLLNMLPGEIKNTIATVNKTYYIYGTNDMLTCQDTLWLPSYREMFGGDDYENSGPSYTSYFNSVQMRIKTYAMAGALPWWLRSGGNNNKTSFQPVSSDGYTYNAYSADSLGVVFGFCM